MGEKPPGCPNPQPCLPDAMTNARKKLDPFLIGPLLLASGGRTDVAPGLCGGRLAAVMDGEIAMAIARENHSALAHEFQKRARDIARDSAIIVLDRTRDLASREVFAARIADEYAQAFGGKSSGISEAALDRIYDDIDDEDRGGGILNLLKNPETGLEKTVFLILPEAPSAHAGQMEILRFQHFPYPLRADIPATHNDMARLTLYHEIHGHVVHWIAGDEKPVDAANDELRADIAAMCGTARDSGGTGAARILINRRDIVPLRESRYAAALKFGGQGAAKYANGRELRTVLSAIEARLAKPSDAKAFKNMDDVALIRFIDTAFEAVKLTPNEYDLRKRTLLDATCIALETRDPENRAHRKSPTMARLAQENPEALAAALDYLAHAADGLFALYDIPKDAIALFSPPQPPMKKRRGLSPKAH